MRFPPRYGPATALLATLLLAAPAGAATVEHLTLGELAERSSRVFIGTVTAQRSTLETEPVRVWTETTFRVERVLKGPPTKRDYVHRQLGGTAGEGTQRYTQKIHGYPEFSVGERVLLFLEPVGEGPTRLVVTGLAQGKFTLRTDAKTGETLALRDTGDLSFVGAPPVKPKTFAGAPNDPNRVPLPQLLDIIDGEKPRPVAPRVLRRPGHHTPQVSLPAPEVAR